MAQAEALILGGKQAHIPTYSWRILRAEDLSEADCIAWETLAKNSGWTSLFQHPKLVKAISSEPFQLLTLSKGSVLKLALPFIVEKRSACRVLTLPGGPIYQYSAPPLANPNEAEDLVAEAIQALKEANICDAILFENMPENSAFLAHKPLRKACFNPKSTSFTDLTQFHNGQKQYVASGSFAPKKMRWSLRRLEDVGKIEMVRYGAGEAPQNIVENAIGHKKDWLEEKGDTSRLFSDEEQLQKFISLFTSVRHSNTATYILTVNGKPVATHLAFETDKAAYLYFTSYDPDYARYKPSAILTLWQIESYIDKKLEIFDFMPPFYDYKSKWCDQTIAVYSVFLPINMRGLLSPTHLKVKAKPFLRKAFNRLPLFVRNGVIHILLK